MSLLLSQSNSFLRTLILVGAVFLGALNGSSDANAARWSTVLIRSIPAGAVIFVDSKDAGVAGTTPHRLRLTRGSHRIVLEYPGYQRFETTIAVTRRTTLTFTLTPEEKSGELTLSGGGKDAEGAEVKIDGKPVGKVPLVLKVPSGRHLVSADKAGFSQWKAWVEIEKGGRHVLNVDLSAAQPQTGSLLISTRPAKARISVDGRAVEAIPALVKELSAGPHIVYVEAEGYEPESRVVKVVANEIVETSMALQTSSVQGAQTGTLTLLANVDGAEFFVDGVSRGPSPATVQHVVPGVHLVEAKSKGYKNAEREITVEKGKMQTVKLSLDIDPDAQPKPGSLTVRGTLSGAEVVVDGRTIGMLPQAMTQLKAGEHHVLVKHPNYAPYESQIVISEGQSRELSVQMQQNAAVAARERAALRTQEFERAYPRGLSSFGAQLVFPGYFTADVSAGFPYIAEGRLTTGIFDAGHLGADIGVELRTYGAMTEIGLMGKVRLYHSEPLALGVMAAIGGGGGPKARNTFYFNAGALASINFKRLVTFTGRAYLNVYTDRHCPSSAEGGELGICENPSANVDSGQRMRDRFSGVRFVISAVLEVPITRNISVFGLFEGPPFQSQRMAFTDPFAAIMPSSDPGTYGRVGATFKF